MLLGIKWSLELHHRRLWLQRLILIGISILIGSNVYLLVRFVQLDKSFGETFHDNLELTNAQCNWNKIFGQNHPNATLLQVDLAKKYCQLNDISIVIIGGKRTDCVHRLLTSLYQAHYTNK
jgi:hypothetical protein